MKLERLIKAVQGSNQLAFDQIVREKPGLGELFGRSESGDSLRTAEVGGKIEDVLIPSDATPLARDPCFCGRVRKRDTTGLDYARHLLLKLTDPDLRRTGVAWVGSVIDNNASVDLTDDLPVVVAIGINYGQGGKYLRPSFIKGVLDETEMRPRFANAAAQIGKAECKTASLQRYHLVAANFFPWITAVNWLEHGFNAIEEALFIRCFGYSDPIKPLIDLIVTAIDEAQHAKESRSYWLIFHGAQNAVPYMAFDLLTAMQKHKDWVSRMGPNLQEIVFSDNLAYPPPVSNAVKLCFSAPSLEREAVVINNAPE